MSISIEAEGPDNLNIVDPDTYASGFPHATFERLRRTDPVSWWEETDGGKGFWAGTRYDDLLSVRRNTAVFSNAQGSTPGQLAQRLAAEVRKWAEVIERAKIPKQ